MPRATRRGAEQVDQARALCNPSGSEQHRRAAGAQQLVADGRHFELGRHRFGEFAQLAQTLELGQEVAQVSVFHSRLVLRNAFLYLDWL
jgi:hypothetical protein